MKTARATLTIDIDVTCPNCDRDINMLNRRDTAGHDHNDDHKFYDGMWDGDDFKCEDVTCSHCKKTFNIEGMDW